MRRNPQRTPEARAALLLSGILAAAAPLRSFGADATQPPGESHLKTIGLVLTAWRPAVYETPGGADECPEGLQFSNRDNYEKQYPTQEARAEFRRRYLRLGPGNAGLDMLNPEQYLLNRGPDGVNVGFNPTAVVDPLPLRTVQGKVSYGVNLDGTMDGRGSPKSCPHQKFVSPDGAPGIDNQLYRVLGCAVQWRKGGFAVDYTQGEFRDDPVNRVLIEISGIEDEHNSSRVTVRVYKGVDALLVDSTGNIIPWGLQRIDVRYPQFMTQTTGKIVNDVLETEPIDQRFALFLDVGETERYLRGMRLRLNLAQTKPSGLVAGYEDLAQWWSAYSKGFVGVSNVAGLWSPPATYVAAHQLADGYPDPSTGQCTAISAAYHVEAVRASIVQPAADDPLMIDGALKLAEGTLAR